MASLPPNGPARPFAAVAAGCALLAGLVVAMASTDANAATIVAADSFSRVVTTGLGSADVGGSYRLGYRGANPFSVAPDGAAVQLNPGSVSARLTAIQTSDVDVVSGISVPTIAAAPPFGLYTAVEARLQGDGSVYRGRATIHSGGTVTVAVSRIAGGSEVGLTQLPLPLRIAPDQVLHLEMSVTGSAPVTIRVRAWTRDHVPNWQVIYADAGPDQISAAGGVGLWYYLCGNCAPLTIRLHNLQATSGPAPSPGPTSGPPPSSASSTSSSASSSASSPASSTSAPSTSAPTTPGPVPTTSTSTASQPPSTSSSASSSSSAPSTSPSSPSTTAAPPPSGMPDRGAQPVGSARYPIPGNAVFVSPSGDDSAAGTRQAPLRTLAAAVSAASPGSTIVLRAGTYHESVFVPPSKPNLTVQSYPGEAVYLDGSESTVGWQQQGSVWRLPNWTANPTVNVPSSYLRPDRPLAGQPDMVFVDGQPLVQVGSPGSVDAGSFYADKSGNALLIGVDPAGHDVRASDLNRALTVSAPGFTLQGIAVERYADTINAASAVYVARPNAVIRNDTFSYAAVESLAGSKADNLLVDHVTIDHAGMLGMGTYKTSGVTVQNSSITASNAEHFNKAPSSGGIKFVQTTNSLVQNSTVSGGWDTHGVWLDVSSKWFTIVGNTVADNGTAPGVEAELSEHGIVANNVLTDDDIGMFVFNTGDVQIYNNDFGSNGTGSVYLLQDARRAAPSGYPDPDCPWIINHVVVADNQFAVNGGPFGLQFYALDGATHIPASAMDITIDGNLFHPPANGTDSMVAWGAGDNHTLTHYDSPAALDAGLGVNWTNAQLPPASFGGPPNVAIPLPPAVATAIGQPVGTRHIGVF